MLKPTRLLLRNATILDLELGTLVQDRSVLVTGDKITEMAGPSLKAPDAEIIDLHGRTLMPGLIDCHVHVNAASADLAAVAEWSTPYVTAHAARLMRNMLFRGFTTVRDVAGADYGIAAAVEEGLFDGPRIVFGGKALSQTGGHGDSRHRGRDQISSCYCSPSLSRVCDGVTEVRRAARDELRRGAFHIKLMVGGGIASPTDRIDSVQFSIDEIRAAVDEADAANRYVTAHAYTSRAITRAVECGVRCIEHGNFMDESTARLMKERGTFYVPTLATYSALPRRGRSLGLAETSLAKIGDVLQQGMRSLQLAHETGIPIAYGTDLLGDMQDEQSLEFQLRSEVQQPVDILRSATTGAAQLLRMEGLIGAISVGAFADMLVVNGDPLTDLSGLTKPETSVLLIMKAGRIFKNTLPT